MSAKPVERSSKTIYSDAKQKWFNAAMGGNMELLQQLIDQHGPEILAARSRDGETACHFALQSRQFEFAKEVSRRHPPLLYGRNKTTGDSPLHLALTCAGAPDGFFGSCIELLLTYFDGSFERISYEKDDQEAERYVRWWQEAVDLLDESVVNKRGKSLIYIAAEKGNFEAVELLLKNPPLDDCSGPLGMNAMYVATKSRNFEMLKILLEYQPGLAKYAHSETFNKPLHWAVTYNDSKMVELLLSTDVTDVDTRNIKGMSPFLLSAANGQKEIFEMFVKYSPHCYRTALTYTGLNALHLAVINEVQSIVELIAENKSLSEMVNHQDEDGDTPLHLAATNGYDDLLKVLLNSKVSVTSLKNRADKTFLALYEDQKNRTQKEEDEKQQKKLVEGMKDFQGGLIVMASLIITVTFTAAFTLPGGYNQSDPNLGMATLARRAGFKVFMISNAIAMGSAITAAAAFIFYSVVLDTRKQYNTLRTGLLAIAISIVFMLVAFEAGVWLVIASQCRWLAISIAAVIFCILVCLAALLAYVYLLGFGNQDEANDKNEGVKFDKKE